MSKNKNILEALNNVTSLKDTIVEFGTRNLKDLLKEEFKEIADQMNEDDMEDDENELPSDDLGAATDAPMGGADAGLDNDDVVSSDDLDLDSDSGLDGLGDDDDSEVVDLTNVSDEDLVKTIDLAAPADTVEIVTNPDGGMTINLKSSQAGGESLDATMGDESGADLSGMEGDVTTDLTSDITGEPAGMEGGDDLPTDDNMDLGGSEPEGEDDDEDKLMYEFNFGKVNENVHKKALENVSKLRKQLSRAIYENKALKTKNEDLLKLTKVYENETKEYKADVQKLSEGAKKAVLQINQLHCVTKLLSEHTTTKDEKMEILNKIDSCTTINETKEVYHNLATKLSKASKEKNSIIENVLDKPSSGGQSKTVLNESKGANDKATMRMVELMTFKYDN